ncbi:MAG: MASE1 domain-containing protein [Actinomycetota bacterium]|nr:MASE1 domain-containing protein [Actinomycetota bacterium]
MLEYPDASRVAVWPAVGIAVVGLVFLGRRAWPGIAIGGFLARLSAEPLAGAGIGSTVAALAVVAGMTFAGVVTPVVAAWLFERYGLNTALTRLRDVLVVVLGGTVSAFLGAIFATSVVFATGAVASVQDAVTFMGWWWLTDTMGIILIAPLLMILGTAWRVRTNPFRHCGAETAALIIFTVIITYLLFSTVLPISFLVFPFVLWAALRLGVPGSAVVNVSLTGTAIWASIYKHGPFWQLPPTQSLVVLQSFNAGVAITSLVLAAVTAERKRATEEVQASRVRIVEAADRERRRVERNLHDGAQQRLVALSLLLRLAQMQQGPQSRPELQATLGRAANELHAALGELRELARGLHPAILTHGGLGAAVQSLVEQAPLPVTVTVPTARFTPGLEITAYFVVCEALANIAKYAQAATVTVTIQHTNGRLSVEVTDDGIGGADPIGGSGLSGLADRVIALGGQLQVDSPPGGGTRVRAELPCTAATQDALLPASAEDG